MLLLLLLLLLAFKLRFNYLRYLFGFQVNSELRRLADSKGPDEKRFSLLSNSVEEFTTCLLEPLRSDEQGREEFGDALDEILEDAIQLEQKKVRMKKGDLPKQNIVIIDLFARYFP